eukprot:COSAG02_NODE_540_length_20599_cov_14.046339_12_plen_155_part_00
MQNLRKPPGAEPSHASCKPTADSTRGTRHFSFFFLLPTPEPGHLPTSISQIPPARACVTDATRPYSTHIHTPHGRRPRPTGVAGDRGGTRALLCALRPSRCPGRTGGGSCTRFPFRPVCWVLVGHGHCQRGRWGGWGGDDGGGDIRCWRWSGCS